MNPLGSSLHAETPPAFRWLPIGVHAVSNPALSVPDARKPDGIDVVVDLRNAYLEEKTRMVYDMFIEGVTSDRLPVEIEGAMP